MRDRNDSRDSGANSPRRTRRGGWWAIIMIMIVPALPAASAETGYDRLNEELVGRGVKVVRKDGKTVKGRFEWVTPTILRIEQRSDSTASGLAPIDIPVDQIAFIEDGGQAWAKVAGAFGGIGVGALGGLGLALSVADSEETAWGMFLGSIAAGGGAGGFVGAKASTHRYYIGPETCVPVTVSEPAVTSARMPQISISGSTGILAYEDSKSHLTRGFGIGVQYPLTRHVKVVGDFAYSSTNKTRYHYEYTWTDDNGTPHLDVSDSEERDRLYEGQVVLRYTWRDSGRFRPYAEGGYGFSYHTTWSHYTVTEDGSVQYDDSYDDSYPHPFRLVGGAGCEIGLNRNLALDLRAQFGTLMDTTARVGVGLKYGF